MIVADLLKKNLFPDFQILAGSGGMGREITAVTVLEAPDADRWMRGGEFMVGSGFVFKDDPEQLTPLLQRMDEKGVAATGFKLDRFHHRLPASMTAEADRMQIPILEIPMHYRWTDIIELVHTVLAQERIKEKPDDLSFFWEESFDFKKLLSGFAQNMDRDLLVQATQLGLNNLFLADGSILGSDAVQQALDAPLVQEQPMPKKGQINSCVEVRNSGVIQHYAVYRLHKDTPVSIFMRLAQGELAPSARHERMLLRAMTVLRSSALEIAILSSKNVLKKERFLEALCFGMYCDPSMIRINLEELGIQLSLPVTVLIVSSADDLTTPVWSSPSPLNYRLGNAWVTLIDETETAEWRNSLEPLSEHARFHFSFGGKAIDLMEIPRSYQEARRTYALLHDFSLPPGVYQYEELSLYAMLKSMTRLPEAGDVWRRYWAPLEEDASNAKRSLSLKELATMMVTRDFNARSCADGLHLHYNTVRNYIRELETLLKVDLKDHHHRLGITLACHINGTYSHERTRLKPIKP
ncbi:MAG: PucR family transcriptional regulator ligand-binding domain-containing protein [Aminobacteriaceae bacterium]